MSKKIGSELKGSFLNDHDFNKYLVKKASFSNLKSNLANCTMCDINDHKMRVKYGSCNNIACNAIEICEKRYKTTICQNTKEIKFYTSGTHNSSSLVYKKHGLTPAVREIIEDLIHNYDNKPKRLHIRLHKKHILPKVDIMPSLKQI